MRYTVGIDEVGRGSLAGPVTVAAVAVPKDLVRQLADRIRDLGKLRDSKKLTAKQREGWFQYFKKHPQVNFAIANVRPHTVDKINISCAANLAAVRSYTRLTERHTLNPKRLHIYLDGGLFIGNKAKSTAIGAKTVIRGDQKIPAIKVASIIAKVSRDRYMVRLAKICPRYGFEIHKGYGTQLHRRVLKKHGPSKVHRLTFIKKYHKI